MVFEFGYNDPLVQAAVIQAVGGVVAAVIAAIAAAVIGKQIADRKRLKAALQTAVDDVEFLLAVESLHCDLHKEVSEESFMARIRQQARDQGLDWSGKFTPGRVRSMSLLNG